MAIRSNFSEGTWEFRSGKLAVHRINQRVRHAIETAYRSCRRGVWDDIVAETQLVISLLKSRYEETVLSPRARMRERRRARLVGMG